MISPFINDQRLVTWMLLLSEIYSTIDKLLKVLFDPLLFTNKKNSSIHRWLSKMRVKFEINGDSYFSEKNKLIYARNWDKRKAIKNLESCFQFNSITSFTSISGLFNYFKDIFGNLHKEKYNIEKFQGLKIGISLFYNFYSKFFWLAADFEYTLKMLIWELKNKLTPPLQV